MKNRKFNITIQKNGKNIINNLFEIQIDIIFYDKSCFMTEYLLEMFRNQGVAMFPWRLSIVGIIPLGGLKIKVVERKNLPELFLRHRILMVDEDNSRNKPFIFLSNAVFFPDLSKSYILNCYTEKDADRLIKPLKKGLGEFLDEYFRYSRVTR